MNRIKLILGASMLLFGFTANAAIIWDETVDGDLPISGVNFGSLNKGNNIFLGTGSFISSSGNALLVDVDNGFFDLDAGLKIKSMKASITSLSESPGSMLFTRFTGLHSPTTLNVYLIDMISETVFSDLLPDTTLGTYQFFTGGGATSSTDDAQIFWDWRIDIKIIPVPEPAAIWLFGIGLIGLIGFSKRRKAA